MEEALAADGEPIPPDGLDLPRDLMPEPGETAAAVRAMAEAEGADEAAPVVRGPADRRLTGRPSR